MKILVISDTHGETYRAEKVIKGLKNIDMIIHLGDYVRDARKLSALYPRIPMEYVYGNCDFSTKDVPSEKVLDCCGKKIFITHGHHYSVKRGYDKLYDKAEEVDADILLFGHTHIDDIDEENGHVLLNPGSISNPRNHSNGSYAIIEISGDNMDYNLIYI